MPKIDNGPPVSYTHLDVYKRQVRVERTGTQPERVGREAAEDALAQGAAGILPAHADRSGV